jgi:hypothetical protein
MITTVAQADLIEAFRSAGGKGPLYCEVPMCYAASETRRARPPIAIIAGRWLAAR